MGNDVIFEFTQRLASSFTPTTGNWYALQLNDWYTGGHIVYTDDGSLRLVSGSATEPSSGSCANWNDILYSVSNDAIVEWQPRNDDSRVWIMQSRGTGDDFVRVESYTQADVDTPNPTNSPTKWPSEETFSPTKWPTVADTIAPTDDVTLSPTDAITNKPSQNPTSNPTNSVTVITPQPTSGNIETEPPTDATEAPTENTDTEGGSDVNTSSDDISFRDAVFGVAVAATTVAYMNFVWVTVRPGN